MEEIIKNLESLLSAQRAGPAAKMQGISFYAEACAKNIENVSVSSIAPSIDITREVAEIRDTEMGLRMARAMRDDLCKT